MYWPPRSLRRLSSLVVKLHGTLRLPPPHGKIHLRLHTRGRKPGDIFQQTDDKMSSFHCDAYGTQLGNLTPVENKIQMQADPQIPRQLKTGCDIPGIAGISRQPPVLFSSIYA